MTRIRGGDRIAVTGASGFVGQTVVEDLVLAGYRVVGVSDRKEPPARIAGVLDDYQSVDLTRRWPNLEHIAGLVHLAGLAAVGPSFDRPQEYISTNSAMATHLFENALREKWRGRVITVSSGAVYDSRGGALSLSENSPLLPTSPYVISKILLETQTEYYRRRGVDAIIVRPFNHIGPGQRASFIVPDLTGKVREWQAGSKLTVGNLNSARDYTDVRDIACAYRLLLELDTPCYATYNVCSGSSRSGWDVLEAICFALGMPIPPTEVRDDRAIDPAAISGNAARLKLETGWQPTIAFQTSINDFARDETRGGGE